MVHVSHPKASDSTRGLILRNGVAEKLSFTLEPSQSVTRTEYAGLAHYTLQPYLLLWDKLAISVDHIVPETLSDDELFLIDCGILVRHSTNSNLRLEIRGQSYHEAREAQLRLYEEFETAEPGCWAVASDPNEPLPLDFTAPGRAVLVRLHDTIPVPAKTVPLDDVFRFTEKRRAEQLALRYHLDGLYQKILSAGDGPLSLSTELTALEAAIADQIEVTRDSKLSFQFIGIEARLKCELDLRLLVAAASAGGILAGVSGVLLGAGLGFASNLIPKIEIHTGSSILKCGSGKGPFEYVVLMRDEL